MMKAFKTGTFGGFDKKTVESYISEQMSSFQKQVNEKEETIHSCKEQINQLNEEKLDYQQQLQQMELDLKKQQEENEELRNTLLLKEDKIKELTAQLSKMEEYVKTVQQQTRTMLEESDKRCTLKLQQMEKEKLEVIHLNALDLFDQIDSDYQKKRKNYAKLCESIHHLNQIIDQADKEAAKQISVLPTSLIKKD